MLEIPKEMREELSKEYQERYGNDNGNYYTGALQGPTDTGTAWKLEDDTVTTASTPTSSPTAEVAADTTTDEITPTNIEDEIHSAYISAERNTGDNRTSGSVAGSAVSNRDINNNKKAGQFLENSHTSVKSSSSLPGYSLL